MKSVSFMTLGCKVNQYDTQAMREAFLQSGYEEKGFHEKCDVYVVNTCMVTGTGERKSMKFVRQAIRQNKDADVIVAGCLAQNKQQELFLPGVRLVLGNTRRSQIVELLGDARARNVALCAVEDLREAEFESMDVEAIEGRSRAVMKIQEGCENHCSYCIIPKVRGPIRSRGLDSIRRQAERLAQAGYLELVLTGIHLSSYGRDLDEGTGLVDAIEAVAGIRGIQRIRLGSLEPGYISRDVARRLAGMDNLCPQFHLSLQSGSDQVLKSMKRQYNTVQYERAVGYLREAFPGCAITTDVICGFPGETNEMFEETLAFSQKMRFSRMHVFPYSEREGTPAASFEGAVPVQLREDRARRLIALAKGMEKEYAACFVGRQVEVLLEEGGKGYTREYVRCQVNGGEEGEIVLVQATDVKGNLLLADKQSST